MRTMGIRELKAHMSEAIRAVQGGETILITNHGEAVALLVSAKRRPDEAERRTAVTNLDALAAEIGSLVPEPTDVAQMISDMRR